MISLTAMFIEPEMLMAIDASELRESAPHWFKLSRLALHAGEYEARPCLTQLMVFQESQPLLVCYQSYRDTQLGSWPSY